MIYQIDLKYRLNKDKFIQIQLTQYFNKLQQCKHKGLHRL